jgi:hypothetical protein
MGLDRPVDVQQVEWSRISRLSFHEGGKVVSLTPRPPFHPVLIPVTFGIDPRTIVRPEGLIKEKSQ